MQRIPEAQDITWESGMHPFKNQTFDMYIVSSCENIALYEIIPIPPK